MKKVTSIRFDQDLWKVIKKHCIDDDKNISEYIEELVKKDLKIK